MVPRGDRSQSVIEPYLTDQWFVRAAPLAAPAIEAAEKGAVRFVPEHWTKTYFDWMRNIQDWCISRQIWWGHRIPAWYDPSGNVYVGRSESEVRDKYGVPSATSLHRDPDVLDTWYSAGLWPFSTLGWPEDNPRLRTFYPTTVLVTGFDIIFFWVARMIMFGLEFMRDVPFREIYIHGLVRDADGNKMSKSKGNILDPLDLSDGIDLDELIAKRTTGLMQPRLAPRIIAATRRQFPGGIPAYGTDALRFTFCSLATQGRDIRFDLGRIAGYRDFCNKLWNAARFVVRNLEDEDTGAAPCELSLADRWIVSRQQAVASSVRGAMDAYRFDLAAQAIYEFTWNEYCDWYLEFAKTTLTDDRAGDAKRRGTRRTLVRVLEALLRLAHPLIPFITEELWQRIAGAAGREGETIMRQSYPEPDPARIDEDALRDMAWVQEFIRAVRRIRGEMNIRPSLRIPVLLQNAGAGARSLAHAHRRYLVSGGGLAGIDHLAAGDTAPLAATALLGDMKLLIPLEGLIDLAAERVRLGKEIDRQTRDLRRSEGKLGNADFVARAPEEIVARERARARALSDALGRLRAHLDTLRPAG